MFECTKEIPNMEKRERLKTVLIELFLLHEGALILPGLSIFIPGGFVPMPQDDPYILALRMVSPRDDWRLTLANQILIYLRKAFYCGHIEAAKDALEWCRKYRLSVPDWLRDAPRDLKRKGERSAETQNKVYETDFTRFIEVIIQKHTISDERKTKTSRRGSSSSDKFARAKERLGDHWTNTTSAETGAIQDSYRRFLKYRDTYYVDPTFLMDLIKVHAPAVFEILSSI
jgi:hypothetical protein